MHVVRQAYSLWRICSLRRRLLFALVACLCGSAAYGQGTVIFPPFPPLPPGPYAGSPTNDLFANAWLLPGASNTVSGNLQGATAETGEPGHDAQPARMSVWWRWTAPAAGIVEVSAGTLRVGVYTGTSISNLTSVAFIERPPTNAGLSGAASAKQRFLAAAGNTYHIAVDTSMTGLIAPSPQPFTLTLELGRLRIVAPAIRTELEFGEPVQIEIAPFDTTDNLLSVETFAGSNWLGRVTSPPFVFAYQPTNPGAIYVRATGTNAQGERIMSLAERLTISPANDEFTNAFTIASQLAEGVFEVSNEGATLEAGEPKHHPGDSAGRSSWWKWQPRFPGEAKFQLTSGYGDLAVYKGESLSSLEKLGSVRRMNLIVRQWDPSAGDVIVRSWSTNAGRAWDYPIIGRPPVYEVVLNAEPGTTYWIAIDATSASWTFSRRTLELHSSVTGEHERIGVPIELEARDYEGTPLPGSVEFVIGRSITWWGGPILTETAVLGRVATPPYRFSWVPEWPGDWHVWARTTNSAGQWIVTQSLLNHVFPANDDLAFATVIRPGARTARLAIHHLASATVEYDEPPQNRQGVHGSLWWRWTPSYSGTVRLQAMNGTDSLELDVFRGFRPDRLQLVGSTMGGRSRADDGVRFETQAGVTYFVRVVNFGVPPADGAVLMLAPPPLPPRPTVPPYSYQSFQPHASVITGSSGFNAVYRRVPAKARRPVPANALRVQGWTRCWECENGCHRGRCNRVVGALNIGHADCRLRCSHGHSQVGTVSTLRRCRCMDRFQALGLRLAPVR